MEKNTSISLWRLLHTKIEAQLLRNKEHRVALWLDMQYFFTTQAICLNLHHVLSLFPPVPYEGLLPLILADGGGIYLSSSGWSIVPSRFPFSITQLIWNLIYLFSHCPHLIPDRAISHMAVNPTTGFDSYHNRICSAAECPIVKRGWSAFSLSDSSNTTPSCLFSGGDVSADGIRQWSQENADEKFLLDDDSCSWCVLKW